MQWYKEHPSSSMNGMTRKLFAGFKTVGHCGLKELDIIHAMVAMISGLLSMLFMLHVQEENYEE